MLFSALFREWLDNRTVRVRDDLEEVMIKDAWNAGAKTMLDELVKMGHIDLDYVELIKGKIKDIYE